MAMQNLQLASATSLPIPSPNNNNPNTSNNSRRVIAFTTPQNYAPRLTHLLNLKGWHPLWSPTVVVEPTPLTKANLLLHLSSPNPNLNPNPNPNPNQHKPSLLENYSAIAFTSRTGISAFSEALADVDKPPLTPSGEIFTISALGNDSELLDEAFVSRLCSNSQRIRVLVPQVATPSGMVEALGFGCGMRVLCPVPMVVGLEEPPVVPNFLRELASKGWVPVRVDGYETRWAGPECAEAVARRTKEGEGLDAVVFTSTGEVEGLLKSLREEYGLEWGMVKDRFPELVVAAHGPVTAAGAERLGVGVDVVSSRFDSFGGVVDALALRWQSLEC